MVLTSVAPWSQPAYCDLSCLELGSDYDSPQSTWMPGETQYSLHRQRQLIAVSEAILYHPLIGLAEVLFGLSQAVCKANK